MKIQILQFSPTKDKALASLEAEYEKRLKPYFNIETLTLPASKSDDRARAQEEERRKLEPKLDPRALLVILDERGRSLSSQEFADFLRESRDFGPPLIQFCIGGCHGIHPELLARADLLLSFSKMTFTHEMIRVFLKEQLYRAAMILAGKSYHK